MKKEMFTVIIGLFFGFFIGLNIVAEKSGKVNAPFNSP